MGTLEASWTVEIEAPRERCYEVAADVETSPEWQGTLQEVEVLERDARGAGAGRRDALRRDGQEGPLLASLLLRPARRAELGAGEGRDQVAHRLVGLRGAGRTQRTRATYGLRTDPGRVLGLLLRGPVEGKVKELLTKSAAEGLKQRVESG